MDRTLHDRYAALRNAIGDPSEVRALVEEVRRSSDEAPLLADALLLLQRRASEGYAFVAALEAAREAEVVARNAADQARVDEALRHVASSLLRLRRVGAALETLGPIHDTPPREPFVTGASRLDLPHDPSERVLAEAASVVLWSTSRTPEWVRALGGLAEMDVAPGLWPLFDRALDAMIAARAGTSDLRVVLRQADERGFSNVSAKARARLGAVEAPPAGWRDHVNAFMTRLDESLPAMNFRLQVTLGWAVLLCRATGADAERVRQLAAESGLPIRVRIAEEDTPEALRLSARGLHKKAVAAADEAVATLESMHAPYDPRLARALFVRAEVMRAAILDPLAFDAKRQPHDEIASTLQRVVALAGHTPVPDRELWFDGWLKLSTFLRDDGARKRARHEADEELAGHFPGPVVHEGQLSITLDRGMVWFRDAASKTMRAVLPARCILDASVEGAELVLRGCFHHSASGSEDHHRRAIGGYDAGELAAATEALRRRLLLPVIATRVTAKELVDEPRRHHGEHVQVIGEWARGLDPRWLGATGLFQAFTPGPPSSRGNHASLDVYARGLRARRGMAFDVTERTAILTEFRRGWEQVERAELRRPLDDAAVREGRAIMKPAADRYVDAVPIVTLSRCPFTNDLFESSLDVFDVDGLFWAYDYDYRPYVSRPRTLFAWTGALALGGPIPEWSLKAMVGPEVPFVLPHILGDASIKAVLSQTRVGAHTGYVIAYFSKSSPAIDAVDDWGLRLHTRSQGDRLVTLHATKDDAENDYDLAPWIERGSLAWIAPGDDSLALRSKVTDCPYLGLAGERRRRYIQEGDMWLA